MSHYCYCVLHQSIWRFIIIITKNTYLGHILSTFFAMIGLYSFHILFSQLISLFITDIQLNSFHKCNLISKQISAFNVPLLLLRFEPIYLVVYNYNNRKHMFWIYSFNIWCNDWFVLIVYLIIPIYIIIYYKYTAELISQINCSYLQISAFNI